MNRRERLINSMGTLVRAAKVASKAMAQACIDMRAFSKDFNTALRELAKQVKK